MKKQLLLLLACVMTHLPAFAQDCCYSNGTTDFLGFDTVLVFDIGGGYRQDTLEWKTYPLSAPGTVIKEKWNDLQIGIIETNAIFLACDHYMFKFDFDYGWFCSAGHQTVKTYNQSTHTLTQDVKAQTKGNVYNIDCALGYQFTWCCFRYGFTPLVGYSYHFQKLKNGSYKNELADDAKFTAKNAYRYRWRGPTVGFNAIVQLACDWQLIFGYTYHWLRYRAKILENFTPGTLPAKQKSNTAYGNEFMVATSYEFCPDWFLLFKFDYKLFQANHGHYETDLGIRGEESSALRNVQLNSFNATMDIGYIF